jgi:hypothetical protein
VTRARARDGAVALTITTEGHPRSFAVRGRRTGGPPSRWTRWRRRPNTGVRSSSNRPNQPPGTPTEGDGGGIEIAGDLAVWHGGPNAVVAAGAHLTENHDEAVTDTVMGEELTLSFDPTLSPASLREEVLGYMRRVE